MEQRGFLGGRMIVDNVIELDTHGRIYALSADAGGCANPSSHKQEEHAKFPALACFDFAAAFPSVAWQYMWLCMEFAGLPEQYIKAFKKLYANNAHFLRFMGK
eukprot:7409673-Karenia_brevis.AAC.1